MEEEKHLKNSWNKLPVQIHDGMVYRANVS
jgi:hypothetical protein